MTDISSPEQALAAFDLGYLSDNDVVQFVIDYLKKSPRVRERPLMAEIGAINIKREDQLSQGGALLRRHVLASDPEYTVRKYASEQFGKTLFKKKLEQYLAAECRPWDLCQMVSAVEQFYDYPPWLGDMRNACDWVDPAHTHETFSHLRWEVEATLEKLK